MKKAILLSILLSLLTLTVQGKKVFRCEKFSLEYPSDFVTIPISNAPHMHLKIGNDKCWFTASYWNKEYAPGTSIWDDELYESCLNMPVNGDLLDVEKITITTKQGKRRAIRMKSVLKKSSYKTYSVNYMMINKGYLFVFCFFSDYDDIFLSSELSCQEKFFKGLSFSNFSTRISKTDSFYDYLLKAVKVLNAQCPFKADEITTFKSVVLSGKTVCIKMVIDDGYIDYVDFGILKDKQCRNFSNVLQKEFFMYLKTNGYSMSYLVYDQEDSLYKVIRVSPQDVLNYYE